MALARDGGDTAEVLVGEDGDEGPVRRRCTRKGQEEEDSTTRQRSWRLKRQRCRASLILPVQPFPLGVSLQLKKAGSVLKASTATVQKP